MSGRARRPVPVTTRRDRPAGSPWPIRIVAAVAAAVVIGALVYAIATGTIFTVTGSR